MYNSLVPKTPITADIRPWRQRRGNTLATGHRIAHVRWIIQTTGIAEAKSLIQKALSHALRERVGVMTLGWQVPANPLFSRICGLVIFCRSVFATFLQHTFPKNVLQQMESYRVALRQCDLCEWFDDQVAALNHTKRSAL